MRKKRGGDNKPSIKIVFNNTPIDYNFNKEELQCLYYLPENPNEKFNKDDFINKSYIEFGPYKYPVCRKGNYEDSLDINRKCEQIETNNLIEKIKNKITYSMFSRELNMDFNSYNNYKIVTQLEPIIERFTIANTLKSLQASAPPLSNLPPPYENDNVVKKPKSGGQNINKTADDFFKTICTFMVVCNKVFKTNKNSDNELFDDIMRTSYYPIRFIYDFKPIPFGINPKYNIFLETKTTGLLGQLNIFSKDIQVTRIISVPSEKLDEFNDKTFEIMKKIKNILGKQNLTNIEVDEKVKTWRKENLSKLFNKKS